MLENKPQSREWEAGGSLRDTVCVCVSGRWMARAPQDELERMSGREVNDRKMCHTLPAL